MAAEELEGQQRRQVEAGGESGPELEVIGGQAEGDGGGREGEGSPEGAMGGQASLGEVLEAPALELMLDVPMEVTVEIDRVQLSLAEVLGLQPGSVVQLNRVPGEPLDLLVNGRLVARGEIVVVNDVFAFRIVEIVGMRSGGAKVVQGGMEG